MTYGCEILFTEDRAEAVQELIEGATGEPCPCKQGKVCPLLPELKVPTPIVKVERVA